MHKSQKLKLGSNRVHEDEFKFEVKHIFSITSIDIRDMKSRLFEIYHSNIL